MFSTRGISAGSSGTSASIAHAAPSRPSAPPATSIGSSSPIDCAISRARARAERGADRELALARQRARDQQVGEVGAADQQHRRDGGEQHVQRCSHVETVSVSIGATSAPMPSFCFGCSRSMSAEKTFSSACACVERHAGLRRATERYE